jgi:hypothetical protein
MSLPPFTNEGLMPVGDYPLTFEQLRASHLVTGEGNASSTWDSAWRAWLVNNLEILVTQLWQVGINRIFIDGSFVENKDHPNDIGGYFECDLRYLATRQLHRDLNAIDPFKVWTWDAASRRPDSNSTKKQLPMWHIYRVELYPHAGNFSGIKDEFGNDQTFPAAFRKSRTCHRPKGIVQIIP